MDSMSRWSWPDKGTTTEKEDGMSERIKPEERVEVTVEIAGPKEGQAVRDAIAELKKLAERYGFSVGTPYRKEKK